MHLELKTMMIRSLSYRSLGQLKQDEMPLRNGGGDDDESRQLEVPGGGGTATKDKKRPGIRRTNSLGRFFRRTMSVSKLVSKSVTTPTSKEDNDAWSTDSWGNAFSDSGERRSRKKTKEGDGERMDLPPRRRIISQTKTDDSSSSSSGSSSGSSSSSASDDITASQSSDFYSSGTHSSSESSMSDSNSRGTSTSKKKKETKNNKTKTTPRQKGSSRDLDTLVANRFEGSNNSSDGLYQPKRTIDRSLKSKLDQEASSSSDDDTSDDGTDTKQYKQASRPGGSMVPSKAFVSEIASSTPPVAAKKNKNGKKPSRIDVSNVVSKLQAATSNHNPDMHHDEDSSIDSSQGEEGSISIMSQTTEVEALKKDDNAKIVNELNQSLHDIEQDKEEMNKMYKELDHSTRELEGQLREKKLKKHSQRGKRRDGCGGEEDEEEEESRLAADLQELVNEKRDIANIIATLEKERLEIEERIRQQKKKEEEEEGKRASTKMNHMSSQSTNAIPTKPNENHSSSFLACMSPELKSMHEEKQRMADMIAKLQQETLEMENRLMVVQTQQGLEASVPSQPQLPPNDYDFNSDEESMTEFQPEDHDKGLSSNFPSMKDLRQSMSNLLAVDDTLLMNNNDFVGGACIHMPVNYQDEEYMDDTSSDDDSDDSSGPFEIDYLCSLRTSTQHNNNNGDDPPSQHYDEDETTEYSSYVKPKNQLDQPPQTNRWSDNSNDGWQQPKQRVPPRRTKSMDPPEQSLLSEGPSTMKYGSSSDMKVDPDDLFVDQRRGGNLVGGGGDGGNVKRRGRLSCDPPTGPQDSEAEDDGSSYGSFAEEDDEDEDEEDETQAESLIVPSVIEFIPTDEYDSDSSSIGIHMGHDQKNEEINEVVGTTESNELPEKTKMNLENHPANSSLEKSKENSKKKSTGNGKNKANKTHDVSYYEWSIVESREVNARNGTSNHRGPSSKRQIPATISSTPNDIDPSRPTNKNHLVGHPKRKQSVDVPGEHNVESAFRDMEAAMKRGAELGISQREEESIQSEERRRCYSNEDLRRQRGPSIPVVKGIPVTDVNYLWPKSQSYHCSNREYPDFPALTRPFSSARETHRTYERGVDYQQSQFYQPGVQQQASNLNVRYDYARMQAGFDQAALPLKGYGIDTYDQYRGNGLLNTQHRTAAATRLAPYVTGPSNLDSRIEIRPIEIFNHHGQHNVQPTPAARGRNPYQQSTPDPEFVRNEGDFSPDDRVSGMNHRYSGRLQDDYRTFPPSASESSQTDNLLQSSEIKDPPYLINRRRHFIPNRPSQRNVMKEIVRSENVNPIGPGKTSVSNSLLNHGTSHSKSDPPSADEMKAKTKHTRKLSKKSKATPEIPHADVVTKPGKENPARTKKRHSNNKLNNDLASLSPVASLKEILPHKKLKRKMAKSKISKKKSKEGKPDSSSSSSSSSSESDSSISSESSISTSSSSSSAESDSSKDSDTRLSEVPSRKHRKKSKMKRRESKRLLIKKKKRKSKKKSKETKESVEVKKEKKRKSRPKVTSPNQSDKKSRKQRKASHKSASRSPTRVKSEDGAHDGHQRETTYERITNDRKSSTQQLLKREKSKRTLSSGEEELLTKDDVHRIVVKSKQESRRRERKKSSRTSLVEDTFGAVDIVQKAELWGGVHCK